MREEVENPLVNDRLWQSRELIKVIDECAGCMEDIAEGEGVYEFTNVFGQKALVHDKPECCRDLIASIGLAKTAGGIKKPVLATRTREYLSAPL